MTHVPPDCVEPNGETALLEEDSLMSKDEIMTLLEASQEKLARSNERRRRQVDLRERLEEKGHDLRGETTEKPMR